MSKLKLCVEVTVLCCSTTRLFKVNVCISWITLKALINKLVILYRHREYICSTLVCILPNVSLSIMLLLLWCFYYHLFRCTPCSGFLLLFFCAISLFSSSETLCLFTLCCSHSAYLLFHISTSALLSCTWLMTVWYLSRVPSVPWYALLCHCRCLVFLSSFFSFSTLEANRL